uniref:Uncharacterized protein n=1 Tax=Arundo donax TaxID=35708 RepID=A0A0A9GE01_ARUDO
MAPKAGLKLRLRFAWSNQNPSKSPEAHVVHHVLTSIWLGRYRLCSERTNLTCQLYLPLIYQALRCRCQNILARVCVIIMNNRNNIFNQLVSATPKWILYKYISTCFPFIQV